jgi:protein-tyrosine phosphatase
VLVSLLGPDEEDELNLRDEGASCTTHGIEFVALPVPDLGAPVDTTTFVAAVQRLAEQLRAGGSVAIHCRQSVGRSGLLAVSIAVVSGADVKEGIEIVSRARGVRVPETDAQRAWLIANAGRLSASMYQ